MATTPIDPDKLAAILKDLSRMGIYMQEPENFNARQAKQQAAALLAWQRKQAFWIGLFSLCKDVPGLKAIKIGFDGKGRDIERAREASASFHFIARFADPEFDPALSPAQLSAGQKRFFSSYKALVGRCAKSKQEALECLGDFFDASRSGEFEFMIWHARSAPLSGPFPKGFGNSHVSSLCSCLRHEISADPSCALHKAFGDEMYACWQALREQSLLCLQTPDAAALPASKRAAKPGL